MDSKLFLQNMVKVIKDSIKNKKFQGLIAIDKNFNFLDIKYSLLGLKSLLKVECMYGILLYAESEDTLFLPNEGNVLEIDHKYFVESEDAVLDALSEVIKMKRSTPNFYYVEDTVINDNNEVVKLLEKNLEQENLSVKVRMMKLSGYVLDGFNSSRLYYVLDVKIKETGIMLSITKNTIVIPNSTKNIVIHSPNRNVSYDFMLKTFKKLGLSKRACKVLMETLAGGD